MNDTLDEFYENIHKPADERIVGYSLARSIILALEEAGLMKDAS